MSNDVKRVVVAAVAIPVALGLVWLGGLAAALAVAALAALGTRELCGLAEQSGVRPLRGLAVLLAILAPLATWALAGPSSGELARSSGFPGGDLLLNAPLWLFAQWPLAAALVPPLVLAATLAVRPPGDRPLEAAAITTFAPFYCGVLPSALLVIRYGAGPSRDWGAVWLVFLPLAVTWICDSFAMWGGRLIGGAKLAPSVSPGKTRAGAVAGLLGGTLAALVYVPLALAPTGRDIPVPQAAVIGLVLALVAQVGDLAESLFKREAGVKDSGDLFPGHGGVLDRLDSLYFVLPVAALLYRAFGVL
ncbi:MAG: phosphatidate cytidylyltransferase [Gemmatimonadales bacterium]